MPDDLNVPKEIVQAALNAHPVFVANNWVDKNNRMPDVFDLIESLKGLVEIVEADDEVEWVASEHWWVFKMEDTIIFTLEVGHLDSSP